jgi:phytoene dehydrogenase-like protein
VSNHLDAIVIGAGHNGLVAACLLAKDGLRVTVLERRDVVGGACVTEELTPGYRVSTAAYSMGLLRPEIVEALDLHRHGLSYYIKDPALFVPLLDGRSFIVWRELDRTQEEIRAIHPGDADAYPRWEAFWDEVAAEVRPLLLAEPPTLADLEREMSRRGKDELFRLAITASAEETCAAFFESDELRGAFASQGMIGTFAGPRDPGTAFVMTYHAFGGDLVGVDGAWSYVRGGMGGITQALARAAEELGVEVRTESPVEEIVVDGAAVKGVRLADGTELHAPVVLSNAEAKRTLALVPPDAVPAEYAASVASNDTTGSVVKVNLVLDELPDFTSRPGTEPGPQHSGTIEISPSVEYLQAAFDDAVAGRMSARPFMEVFIQSVTDDSLAPPGKHVASCFAQWAPGSVPMAEWEPMREAAGDAVVGALAEFAPNVTDAIRFRQVLGPADLEARFGLTGGNIFHGELLPGNILADRLGARTPVAGLYLCGSSAHPGGAVTGAPGWNAARALLADRSG